MEAGRVVWLEEGRGVFFLVGVGNCVGGQVGVWEGWMGWEVVGEGGLAVEGSRGLSNCWSYRGGI